MENIIQHIRENNPEVKDLKITQTSQYENLTVEFIFENGKKIMVSPLSLINDILGKLNK